MSLSQIKRDIRRQYPKQSTEVSLRDMDLSGLNQKDFKRLIKYMKSRFRNLQTLDLSGTGITQLPEEIGTFNNLTNLDISRNSLDRLPAEIGNLRNLTNLNANFNSLTQLPAEIGDLNNLTNLNLAENNINQLPTEIGQLNNLTHLNLAENSIAQLPAEIGQLNNLTNLNLYFNSLTQLPAEIGNLNNLTHLNISNNRPLTALPTEIGGLTNLTNLSISNNQNLVQLPADIGSLTSLTNLDITNNPNLTRLPTEIGNLNNLISLNVSSNSLDQLPIEIGNLNNLTNLNANFNRLTQLPTEIGNLNNLTNLDVSRNQVTQLPVEISNLNNLINLNVSNNQFTQLPTEIGQLNNLVNLDVSNNQFTQLPTEIGQLNLLRNLNVANNNLNQLPAEIDQLNQLRNLNISNNTQFNNLPDNIAERFSDNDINIEYRNTSGEVTLQLNQAREQRLSPQLNNYEQVLATLYDGQDLKKMRRLINSFEDERKYQTGSQSNDLSAKEVVQQLLLKAPKHQGAFQPSFNASLKDIMDKLENPVDRENHLATMAVSLGSCDTPVYTYIASNTVNIQNLDQDMSPLILRLAVQNKIEKLFVDELKAIGTRRGGTDESIEAAVALTNSVLLEGVEGNTNNRLKITGDRDYTPSSSVNIDYGFRLFNQHDNALFERVAKLFCKTNNNGDLIKRRGNYSIDKVKLEAIKLTYATEKGIKDKITIDESLMKNLDAMPHFLKEFDKKSREILNKDNLWDYEEIKNGKSKDIYTNRFNDLINLDSLKSRFTTAIQVSDDPKVAFDNFFKDFDKELDVFIADAKQVLESEKQAKAESVKSINALAVVPPQSQRSNTRTSQDENRRLSRTSSRRNSLT